MVSEVEPLLTAVTVAVRFIAPDIWSDESDRYN